MNGKGLTGAQVNLMWLWKNDVLEIDFIIKHNNLETYDFFMESKEIIK